MNEYLPRILAALAGLFAIGWYFGHRRGYAKGLTDGYLDGPAVGQADSRAAEPTPRRVV